MPTEKEKMLAGGFYSSADPEIMSDAEATRAWLHRYNSTGLALELDALRALLAERLGFVGDEANVLPPFHCDYGFNIRLGAGAFLNFGCIVLDVVAVTIGERTQIGPGVKIMTADHPRDPEQRDAGVEFARPITIGRNVWIGGGAMILPGVTIGDDAIIGAGSVVTRDVPAGATAYGNPARVKAGDPTT